MNTGAELRLYNSLSRKLEVFEPSGGEGEPVRMYSCGPVAFSSAHLGILRGFVCVDLLRRALRWKGHSVRQAMMITDVVRAGVPEGTDPELHIKEFLDSLAALNVLPATHYPRASEHIDDMIAMAGDLERRGHAYRLDSGLYFDTSRSPGYGELAGLDLDAQREGASAESIPGRRNKNDFALWRLTGEDAEAAGTGRSWDSPWGRGLPGSHLPCSAASTALLGPHLDIHTGGRHHRSLHHVNEIAQSQAHFADARPWVRHWLHHGALTAADQPMVRHRAPHLGDLTARELHPMAFRLLLLRGHYHRDLAYTDEGVVAAQATLRRLLARHRPAIPHPRGETRHTRIETYQDARRLLPPDDPAAHRVLDRMDTAICADLNTAQVLAELQQAVRSPDITEHGLRVVLAGADALLGLRLTTLDPAELAQQTGTGELPLGQQHLVDRLIADRTAARARKDWERADTIRAQLSRMGIEVTDAGSDSTWTLRRDSHVLAERRTRI
ncbi:hypothetical protein [Streptomyces sp. SCSIO ZS0520]|uniref:CysS/YqeB C-terminal domain-containing protein n=1 Tax=Streptomyces sp. SCSIO ZS0520 TaxID=2892996 RepID=UPI0021D92A48|nr:hypothetical protein [Streptomyces sp. SCSIO ZS0520]